VHAAIYLRVSTDGQTTDNQERELRATAERAGHEVVEVYRDAGISGAKGRDKRPGFDAMNKDAARRRLDVSWLGLSMRVRWGAFPAKGGLGYGLGSRY
jgi:DNA invertase Pin-like site-specific DNA recombinase